LFHGLGGLYHDGRPGLLSVRPIGSPKGTYSVLGKSEHYGESLKTRNRSLFTHVGH